MRIKDQLLTCVGTVSMLLILASPSAAAAAEVSVSIGPVPVPDSSVEVCINDTCVTTPELSSLTLDASVSATGLGLPVVVPAPCSGGRAGVVLTVVSVLPSDVTISGELSGQLPAGGAFSLPLGPITVPSTPTDPTTISVCAEL